MITIKTDVLAAIAKWAYREEDRPHIGCLLFDTSEIVATDGHRLVRVPHNIGARFAVSRSHVLAAVAAQDAIRRIDEIEVEIGRDVGIADDGESMLYDSPRSGRTIELQLKVDPMRVEFAIGSAMLVAPATTGSNYPAFEAVMPTAATGPMPHGIGFNPMYLAAIGEVLRANGERWPGVQVVAWAGVESPMMYRSEKGVRFVVMPHKDWSKQARTKAHEREERRAVAHMQNAVEVLRGDS